MTESFVELARYAAVELPQKPMLVPWVQPVELDGGLLQLRSPESFYNLRHPLLAAAYWAVRPLLTGDRTVDEISASVEGDILPTTALFLLKLLRAMGLLLEGAVVHRVESEVRGQHLFLSQFNCDPAVVAGRLATEQVVVTGSETLGSLVETLARAVGCRVARLTAWEADDLSAELVASPPRLVVMCTDAPMRSMAIAVNQFAVAHSVPWLHVAVLGTTAFIGPLVIPGETACYECFEARLRANMRGWEVQDFRKVPALGDFRPGDMGSFPPFLHIVAGYAASEVTRFIGGYAPPATVGQCYEVSAMTPGSRRHFVLRVPTCTACHPRAALQRSW